MEVMRRMLSHQVQESEQYIDSQELKVAQETSKLQIEINQDANFQEEISVNNDQKSPPRMFQSQNRKIVIDKLVNIQTKMLKQNLQNHINDMKMTKNQQYPIAQFTCEILNEDDADINQQTQSTTEQKQIKLDQSNTKLSPYLCNPNKSLNSASLLTRRKSCNGVGQLGLQNSGNHTPASSRFLNLLKIGRSGNEMQDSSPMTGRGVQNYWLKHKDSYEKFKIELEQLGPDEVSSPIPSYLNFDATSQTPQSKRSNVQNIRQSLNNIVPQQTTHKNSTFLSLFNAFKTKKSLNGTQRSNSQQSSEQNDESREIIELPKIKE
eukprot:403361708